ncbi:hypothetical protein [Mucilaginibacter flavidus]|uniref:hypothetical protein n=1 Tax=Mucilaginibacter flavidus TaxID=2949309 RepID=UPI00209327B4|nr:hypothetical protein [Mucilaginibacter flavidus]MCO5947290.1 hypothetical protein [Mucilaginibacter flavidus]
MAKKNILRFSIITFITSFLISSCIKVKGFTNDELKWFIPYNKTDTVVFISNKGEIDTVVFLKKVASSDTVRSLERGYYNTNYLTVTYTLTKGSYHQFALMSDRKTRYSQDILNISKTSDGTKTLEITFLGTIFNGKELNNIRQENKNEYYFDSSKATYVGMDEEQGKAIKNFTFDVRFGIVKYVDERNIEWNRK